MNVLLISTYELGHQPLGVARPAAHLLAAGHDVACADLSVEHLDEEAVRRADFIGVSVPMHTATRLGVRLSERLRTLNPRAHVCFYGLYASLNAGALLGRYADSVIGGEFETPLVELVGRLANSQGGALPSGVITLDGGDVFLGRQPFLLPARQLLPPLEKYSRLDDGAHLRLAGYVEASRGCAHRCLHCPIPPVYGGRLRIVPEEVVLEDIRRLVDMGAEHITFGDPDFFNGIKHSRRIVESLHGEFPSLTYDVTIKIEHLLEHRALLPLLRETGCRFVVSAVEAVDDTILANLRKGHTAADVEIAIGLMAAAGLVLRPTWVAFTPWTTPNSYLRMLGLVEKHGLIRNVDPVQYAIRLLVPRGSSLIGTPAMDRYLGSFDESIFTFTWKHPDLKMDALQREVSTVAEQAARTGEDPVVTFYRIKDLTLAAHYAGTKWAAGRMPGARQEFSSARSVHQSAMVSSAPVPKLTEPWFC
jgi:radical SAM superfamily enzyme YgiQ (UPF0313 family)